MRFRSRVATTVVALPLILGIAACGSQKADNSAATTTAGSAPTPVVTTTAAPQKVAPAVAHLSTASFLPTMKKSMVGKDSVRVTMKMVAGGQTMTVTGVQTMKPVAMQLEMNGAAFGGKAKMIVVKDMLYMSSKDVPGGKYVKIDPKDSSDPTVAGLGEILKDMDPRETFASFDSGLKGAKFIRTETVDGRKLDRYAVTVDMAAAFKAKGEKMVAGVPKTLVYTIWMGSTDHLMYKIFFEMSGVSMTMNASDWGKPVTIKAPPASKILSR